MNAYASRDEDYSPDFHSPRIAREGDVEAVVQAYSTDAIEVEFVTASGDTQALVTPASGPTIAEAEPNSWAPHG